MKISFTTLTLGLASQGLGRAVVDIEQRSHTDEVAHGNYANFDGIIQRWHEVGEDLFLTVDPDKWDDNVHVRRSLTPEKRAIYEDTTEAAPFHEVFPDSDTSPVPRSELEQRDWDKVCTVTLQCATAVQNAAVWAGLSAAIPLNKFITKITQVIGPRIWDILMRDETQVGIVIGAVGVGTATFSAQIALRVVNRFFPEVPEETKEKTPSPATCDPSMSQEDMAKEMIRKACHSSPERNSFKLRLDYPDDSYIEVLMGAKPGQAISQTDICLPHSDDILLLDEEE